jgi:hypothetical protein
VGSRLWFAAPVAVALILAVPSASAASTLGFHLTVPSGAFGSHAVGTTSAAEVETLKNTGTETLTGIKVSLSGGNPSDFLMSNGCGSTLPRGKSCKITIRFRPRAKGLRTARFQVSTKDAGLAGVLLSGYGTQTAPK